MLLGVGGTIYNNDTLEAFKELGLDCQRVEQLACFRVLLTLCHLRCQTCSNQTCPFRYQYKLSLRAGEIRTSLQPSYSPLVSSSFVSCWRSCMVPGTKAGSFSLNNARYFYACLHTSFLFFLTTQPMLEILFILPILLFIYYMVLRSVGPGRCLIANCIYSVLQCHKQHCAFFPFPGFFL